MTTTATMAGTNDIFYSPNSVMEMNNIVIANATNRVLKRGTLLGKITASGKYAEYNSDKSDGTQTPVGVLAETVDASTADQKTFMYLGGEFNASALFRFTGATTISETTVDAGIYNNLIIAKKEVS